MKRYYLSQIFQSEEPGMGMVWRHRLQMVLGIDYVGGEIAVDPATGTPVAKALLVLVGGINHARLVGEPGMVALPQVSPDLKVSAIQTQTKLDCKANIVALGFPAAEVDAVFNAADGMRDVLNYFGRLNNPTFDANNFDLDES